MCNFASRNEKNHRDNYELVWPYAPYYTYAFDVPAGQCPAGRESCMAS